MLPQLFFLLGGILIIPIVPLLIWQGKRVKNTISNLPEAIGTKGQILVNESFINLLTIGESTFAGVGVHTHEEGVTGQLAKFLSEKTNRSVNWEVLAQSGYSAKMVLKELVPKIPQRPLDVIVIGLGGNDTFELNFPMRWQKDLIDIITEIQKIQPESCIVIATLPPVGSFPAFPFPLNAFLGGLERLHSWAVKPIPSMFKNVYFDDKRFEVTEPEIMFSDGVHPSGYTYSLWGKQLTEFIVGNELIKNKDNQFKIKHRIFDQIEISVADYFDKYQEQTQFICDSCCSINYAKIKYIAGGELLEKLTNRCEISQNDILTHKIAYINSERQKYLGKYSVFNNLSAIHTIEVCSHCNANFLFVFGAGEIQPSRESFWISGIWSIEKIKSKTIH